MDRGFKKPYEQAVQGKINMRNFTVRAMIAGMLLVFAVEAAAAKEKVVEISGMSIIGNRELPKTLYIVPWKDSDVDSETSFAGDLLNENMKAVDQQEFTRQLKYYELSR